MKLELSMARTYLMDIGPHVEGKQQIRNMLGQQAQDEPVITQRERDKATKQQANTRDDSLTYCDTYTERCI